MTVHLAGSEESPRLLRKTFWGHLYDHILFHPIIICHSNSQNWIFCFYIGTTRGIMQSRDHCFGRNSPIVTSNYFGTIIWPHTLPFNHNILCKLSELNLLFLYWDKIWDSVITIMIVMVGCWFFFLLLLVSKHFAGLPTMFDIHNCAHFATNMIALYHILTLVGMCILCPAFWFCFC